MANVGMKKRSVILAVGAGIAALVALHPPWTARAVVNYISFKGFPAVPPVTVVDTVTWEIPFAAIYARPSLGLTAEELTAYQARISKGDTSAIREWRERTEDTERRYHVPDTLRSEWIRTDSAGAAPSVAFSKKIVAAHFAVDVVRLGVYLLVVGAAIATAVILIARRAKPDA
jgi:hypothetical protein